ncbi:hypothetical protein GOODEAATRI_033480 [Goodea atripinnis]|uniref:Uncharacterized protein n=1 Tax=Goodea atripinnis TaxID=208336 RepID=A0ABV0Q346_9TELE
MSAHRGNSDVQQQHVHSQIKDLLNVLKCSILQQRERSQLVSEKLPPQNGSAPEHQWVISDQNLSKGINGLPQRNLEERKERYIFLHVFFKQVFVKFHNIIEH